MDIIDEEAVSDDDDIIDVAVADKILASQITEGTRKGYLTTIKKIEIYYKKLMWDLWLFGAQSANEGPYRLLDAKYDLLNTVSCHILNSNIIQYTLIAV